ncbi:sigma-70 family RNA polymerase sigma factor [Streptomyces sp. A1547]|uniref:sigma-70 family RNA polymerase sigma factor n=1 Tax=Streptomyces sp. A1547 TaxID=2563105 RepID=UPI00109EE2A6|nr:sigma-70 family RNA polymerase sigma factor [Streptomyces sp. A1547]THA40059.1 sigma-70 family RNA polymerase sigma factor [Streptomyces sp. A1547]
MTTQHTAALVAAARAGDARAQDELVSTYLPLVYNIVGRALNGSCDVDDVVQDTMLRALDGLGTLRSDESFRSWLVAIAMNRVRAHWQARHSAPGESGLEAAWELADPGADFVDLTVLRLQLEGQQRETARATRWLETDDRALLSLWWLECAGELTRAEVAAALELSPQHTAVRVQRMKAQLESARVVERALGTQPPCEALRTVTAGWDGLPSTLWRKRIARHARECVQCAGLWGGLLPAEGLLAGLALVPVSVALLAGVRAAAAGGIVPAGAAYAYDGGAGAYAGGLGGPATGTGPGFDGTDLGSTGFDGTGFDGRDFGGTGFDGADLSDAATQLTPTVSGQGGIPDAGAGGGRSVLRKRRRSRRRAIGGAVLAACVAGGGLAYLGGFPGSNDEETAAAPATPVSALSAPDAGSAPPSDSASPSASASPSPSASASPSPSAESPSPSPSPTKSKAPASPPPAPAPAPAPAGVAGQVIALVNSERAAAGCGPLKEDPQLREAAQGHSDDMAARDFFAHTNPDGADPGKRTTASGYRWSTYGENIAKGQQTAASVMDSWMKSPGHRANILNCSFKDIGVGIHTGPGGPWWTQNFGAKM